MSLWCLQWRSVYILTFMPSLPRKIVWSVAWHVLEAKGLAQCTCLHQALLMQDNGDLLPQLVLRRRSIVPEWGQWHWWLCPLLEWWRHFSPSAPENSLAAWYCPTVLSGSPARSSSVLSIKSKNIPSVCFCISSYSQWIGRTEVKHVHYTASNFVHFNMLSRDMMPALDQSVSIESQKGSPPKRLLLAQSSSLPKCSEHSWWFGAAARPEKQLLPHEPVVQSVCPKLPC